MKLKRIFQLVEELASYGFDSIYEDLTDEQDLEYRSAVDGLWSMIENLLEIHKLTCHIPDPFKGEHKEAVEWLKSKDAWT